MNIRNSENITFKNIDFFAGSITIRGTKHFTLENCRFSFNSDMGLLGNSIEYSPISTVRNCIFEYINDGHSWSQQLSSHPVLENVLFRYNDWFGGTAWSPTTDRNYRGDSMSKLKLKVTNPGMVLNGVILQLRIVSQLESLQDLGLWWSMLD